MYCTNHPNRVASATCSHCGRPYCSECLTNVNGRLFCQADLGNAYNNQQYTGPMYTTNQYVTVTSKSQKNWLLTLLLAIFFGPLGIHRFYAGKIGTGLLYFFTGGLCAVGYIYDIIKIASGTFRDGAGQVISQ